jgi:hypothetical protein
MLIYEMLGDLVQSALLIAHYPCEAVGQNPFFLVKHFIRRSKQEQGHVLFAKMDEIMRNLRVPAAVIHCGDERFFKQ